MLDRGAVDVTSTPRESVDRARGPRSALRAVALPAEHGGWGLTLEPILLGLLVAPSAPGFCIGLAALVAFVARTPLKLLLIDARRGRRLPRTLLARRVLAVEVAVLGLLVAVPVVVAPAGSWLPLLITGPLLALELWFDMRSRGRRLVPELAGAVGIGGVVALVVLVGGGDLRLAIALWLIVAARAVTSIVTVRDQVGRLHGRPGRPRVRWLADLVAALAAAVAVVVDPKAALGAGAVAAVVVAQRLLGRPPLPRAVVLGLRQTAMGLTVVLAAALGVELA